MFGLLSRVLPNRLTQSLVASYYSLRSTQGIHSSPSSIKMPGMTIKVLPALEDNYMYLIIDDNTKEAAIVDPVTPDTVVKAVEEEGVNLTTVLTTHHHWDHSGGNKKLVERLPGLTVFGGDDRVDALNKKVGDGTKLNIGSLNVECLATPCHTSGHVCYFVTDKENTSAVFTGDTLFIAGCGRFFEGTPNQMYDALIEKLGMLPDATQVYCGHEYTTSNLKFAKSIDPENKDVIDKLEWSQEMRNKSMPTVPSTIGDEKKYNPFMRVKEGYLQKTCGTKDAIETMGHIRKLKDSFKA